jgi:hypothetical protein
MKLTNLALKPAWRGATWKYLIVAILSASVSAFVFANAQPQKLSPGAQPFVPTRIDWLTTTLQASLRDDQMQATGFLLQITSPDPETILIYVRYLPDVNREVMNMSVDSSREVIQITAKRYGWDRWVKIREDVQPAKQDSKK